MLKRLAKHRRTIQAVIAFLVVILLWMHWITLAEVLLFGSLSGIVAGKVFCRWACPMGFIIESMLGTDPRGRQQQLYMYYKMGCPIAWVSGLLNRLSLFTLKNDVSKCTSCGACDKMCYIATFDKDRSHFRPAAKAPGNAYSCSRCLECVRVCPTKSLTVGLRLPGGRRAEKKEGAPTSDELG